jgi:hypothetical protein
MARDPNGYDLRPYQANGCIFVHIPRTAGTAIASGLFQGLGGGHTSIASYALVFSREEFTRFFKFAFVRNPWDRVVSAYFHLKAGGASRMDTRWAARHLAGIESFEQFVELRLTTENVLTSLHFRTQTSFIAHPVTGETMVDFLGRVEDLQRDLRYVSDRLGKRVELARVNAASGRFTDYRRHYTDKIAEIVASVYVRDIAALGYSF